MKETDARRLKYTELTELRKRVVSAVQGGKPVTSVAKILGIQRSTVFGWLARYRQGGWDALDAHKRGGRPPKMTAKMLAWIYDWVVTKDPQQMYFPFALWTSYMVAELVWRHFEFRLSRASVCRLLNQLGLSPKKPLWRAFQKNHELVEKWVKEEYPQIITLARKQKADIFFGDETGVRTHFHPGKTRAVGGKTPIISTAGGRFGSNMISAISPRGTTRFMVVQGNVNVMVFLAFLKRLLHNWPRPILLIVDDSPVHRSEYISQFVTSSSGKLRLFYLPPYFPELK